jgi:Ycf66 protein N-terminus
MLNWSLGLGGILGIVLALSGVGLYFLRTLRPNLARDHDIFFAAVALLCGGILLFQSWRLDPILQFAQFLSIGSAIWFGYEAIRLRGIATEQAKRATPLVDDERPVSRVYRAELDELTPLEEQRTVTRRIRGSRDSRPSEEDYREDVRRRPSGRTERFGSDDPPRRRPSRPLPPERSDWEAWDEGANAARNDVSGSQSGMRETIRDNSTSSRPPSSRRSNRPAPSPRRRGGSDASDYVDYQPVDFPDEGTDNPRDDWR